MLICNATLAKASAAQKGAGTIPKKNADFPESLNLRLTVQQREFLDNVAEIHGLRPSDVMRGLIDTARADSAINTLENFYAAFE